MTIGSYGSEVVVSPWLTGDPRILERVLDEEMWQGLFYPASTAIHRAAMALPTEASRPAVILIGTDLPSDQCTGQHACVDRATARRTVIGRGTTVYAVITGTNHQGGSTMMPRNCWDSCGGPTAPTRLFDGPVLASAKEAGGFLRTQHLAQEAWPRLARDVLDEIRQRYVLGFVPRLAGNLEGVVVRVGRPDVTVRVIKARAGRSRQ